MFLSVTCAEDVPRIDPATIPKRVKGTFLGDYRIRQQIQACKAWPRASVPPDGSQPVRADTPVLLMSGDMDPVTPASYGEEIVQTLSSGRHVVFKDNGHAIGNAESCIGSLVHQLTAGVSPARLDAYCADPR